MLPLDVYRRYVSQRRTLAPRGFALDSSPARTRLTPRQPDLAGLVSFTALSVDEIETAIADNLTLGVEGTYTAATESLVTDNIQVGQVSLRPEVLAGKVSLKFHF